MASSENPEAFFNKLRYSFGNEDWLTEQKALQLKPDDEVVCITASGDRPLNLLIDSCKKLIAIDANPIQNYLLQLKMAAVNQLNYNDYAAFLGLTDHPNRLVFLEQVLSYLSEASRTYWLNNKKNLQKGILYRGATEKWALWGTFLLKQFRNQEIQSLFKCKTLEEQKQFLKTGWNHNLWKKSIAFFVNPLVVRLFFKDPGLYAHYDSHIRPGGYVYDRMLDYLNLHLAKDNFFMQLIFLGQVSQDVAPPYLQETSYASLQQNISKIGIETNDIVRFLENSPSNSYDKFSLSDVASYLSYDNYVRLLKAMHHSAKPGARFCLRQFISRYRLPEEFAPLFKIEPDLAKELEKQDRAFVYHFTVGTVCK